MVGTHFFFGSGRTARTVGAVWAVGTEASRPAKCIPLPFHPQRTPGGAPPAPTLGTQRSPSPPRAAPQRPPRGPRRWRGGGAPSPGGAGRLRAAAPGLPAGADRRHPRLPAPRRAPALYAGRRGRHGAPLAPPAPAPGRHGRGFLRDVEAGGQPQLRRVHEGAG